MNALAARLRDHPWLLPLLAALLYGGAYLAWYWGTPFGVAPVLDEKENLELARQIAAGALPAEPFYRAMGYPLLLALFPALGLPVALQPFAATALGLALHAANSALVAVLARRLFGTLAAALIAGLLHALNPVLLFYATQILDGALANTLFLLGLAPLFGPAPAGSRRPAVVSALAWSLAALVRPQFLVLLPLWPVAWWCLRRAEKTTPPAAGTRNAPLKPLLIALGAAALPWLALGLWQKERSGEFRLLPTQGAYNLWAANRPGADGRYFIQSIHLPPTDDNAHQNPTLRESLVLFERETGRPAASLDEANAHWRARLRAALLEDPLAWLALTARKALWLLNDYDAYNNKTYAYHQARAPWLAPNPLGWGLLLSLAIPGAFVLAARRPRAALVLAAAVAVVAGGILLTFVSGRFRLPLAALLCVCSGGLTDVAALSIRVRLAAALAVLAAAILAFGDWFGARDTRTFLQDDLLLASSAIAAGDDTTAWEAAGSALARAPDHPDALAWRVTAGFNRLLAAPLPVTDEQAWRDASRALLARPYPVSADLQALAALALWRAGETDVARETWRRFSAISPESQASAALAIVGAPPVIARGAPFPTKGPLEPLAAAKLAPRPSPEQIRLRALADDLFKLPPDQTAWEKPAPPPPTPARPPANPRAAADNEHSARSPHTAPDTRNTPPPAPAPAP